MKGGSSEIPVPLILVTGTVGAGKTTVAAEMNDLLSTLKIPNAALDLDALVLQWPATSEWNDDLMFENLASLWSNYRAHGTTHLILSNVLEDRCQLDRYRVAVPGAEITVCRLMTPESARLERLHARHPLGWSRDWHLARTVELEDLLDQRSCEDFTVENGDRTVGEVAREVLVRAGWISADSTGSIERETDQVPHLVPNGASVR